MYIFLCLVFMSSIINGMQAGKANRSFFALDKYGINKRKISTLKVKDDKSFNVRDITEEEILQMITALQKLNRSHIEMLPLNAKAIWNYHSDEYKREIQFLKFLLMADIDLPLHYKDLVDKHDDESGFCPLHLVVKDYGHRIDPLQKILSLGADIDQITRCLKTALLLAVENEDFAKVLILLKNGADPDGCLFMDHLKTFCKIRLSNKEKEKRKLSKDELWFYDVNIIENISKYLPLAVALKAENKSIIRLLLSHGADVNFLNKKNQNKIEELIKW